MTMNVIVIFTRSLKTPSSSWNLAATKSSISYWCSPAQVSMLDWQTHSTLNAVSTGMGDHLREGISPQYVFNQQTRSTQPCIHPALPLNQVPALAGRGKGGNVTAIGWQVTLCDPIWHVSSHSGQAGCKLLYSVDITTTTITAIKWPLTVSGTTPYEPFPER